jgi:MtrB/PioB family decaheme-associated outer membrane protein
MRNKMIIIITVLLLVSAFTAMAQQDSKPAAEPMQPTGFIDVGYRGTSTAGDAAQYERYRDTRDGVYSHVVFGMETSKFLFNFEGWNAGYRDQSFKGDFKSQKWNLSIYHDETPLNYAYYTQTPWVEAQPGVFTLNSDARTQVQNKKAMGIPASYAQAQQVSIYRGLAQNFRIQQRRDDTGADVKYSITKEFGIFATFKSSHKTGYQPYGMSFAFNNANELPMPLDNRTNDFSAGFNWVKDQAMFTASIDHSSFSNEFNEYVWDNPLRATDFSNGLTPPNGPYDPSGYSNGNGPAQGRMSAAPDNGYTWLTVKGQYRMPRRTVINATLQVGDMHQNDDLIPWTTNSVINQPLVWNAFPSLKELERPTAEARIRTSNALVTLSSKPLQRTEFNVRWRHNSHVNMSRPFDAVEYVRFDAVPEETGGETAGHDIVRDTLDAYVTFDIFQSALRFGYGYDNFNRTGRAHNDMRDNAFRVSFDSFKNQHLQVRFGYEYVDRTGSGFSEGAVEEGGSQPGLRYYDEADRTRHRVNANITIMPYDKLDIVGAVTYIDDSYGGPGLEFGLLDNSNAFYNVGINFNPFEKFSIGANFGVSQYDAFQKARNANPPPDPTWTDPSRDWTLDNSERVQNIDVYMDLVRLIKRTDLHLGYSFSDSNNGFGFGGPRVATLAGIKDSLGFPNFMPLPNVTNSWHSLNGEVKFQLMDKYGLAFGYRWEKFHTYDWATINLPYTYDPRIDYLGGLMTGYGSRPYRGQTATIRLFRNF